MRLDIGGRYSIAWCGEVTWVRCGIVWYIWSMVWHNIIVYFGPKIHTVFHSQKSHSCS